jgi:hypothetical protein
MKASELIERCKYKPKQMGCCEECKGKSKKDCEPNPLNCVDFYIFNLPTIEQIKKELSEV